MALRKAFEVQNDIFWSYLNRWKDLWWTWMLQMGQYYVTGFESFYTYSKKNTFHSFVGLKNIGTFSCSSNCKFIYIIWEFNDGEHQNKRGCWKTYVIWYWIFVSNQCLRWYQIRRVIMNKKLSILLGFSGLLIAHLTTKC